MIVAAAVKPATGSTEKGPNNADLGLFGCSRKSRHGHPSMTPGAWPHADPIVQGGAEGRSGGRHVGGREDDKW